MSDMGSQLKALSDPTRLSIVELLLRYSFCAGALSRRLDISEAAVSQYLKILHDCGVVSGEKCGYFMQYEVNRDVLDNISSYFASLSDIKRLPCDPTMENCDLKERCICHSEKRCRGCDCCNDCKRCHKTESLRT
jgi:ArsR family transcriptional regulator